MFDVSNIKIGDYVKTRDSYVGYVTDLSDNLFLFRYYTEENGLIGVCTGSNLSSVFKQIGTYKFDEEEKKEKYKIKPLEIEVKHETKKCDKITTFANGETTIDFGKTAEIITGIKDIPNYEVYAKINEIIDYLNKR